MACKIAMTSGGSRSSCRTSRCECAASPFDIDRQVSHRAIQSLSDPAECGKTDAVCAGLLLLNLLERDTDYVAEADLAYPLRRSTESDRPAE